jgi:guanylate cyclase soluble subunit beta
MLSKIYRRESETEEIGTLVESDESNFPLSRTTKALYAENVDNVCIIFADIVGFSRISLELEPLVVVNMLQDLFARFDELCDLHQVQKLETIGDAFIVTAGINEKSNNGECVQEYAVRILNMAKDMVHQARHVLIPTPGGLGKNAKLFDSLEIRGGIHVGNVTCGVLGQRLPKMTVFGKDFT